MKRKAMRFTSAVFLIIISLLGLIVQPVEACNSNNSAKSFTVQDTDPSSLIFKGSIGNSHKVNESFPVHVFVTNYGQAGKPLTFDYDVPVTVKLKGPGHYEQDYPATLSKGEKYVTVNVTCPSAGVWSIYVSGYQEKNGSNKHDDDSELTLAGPWTFYVGSKNGVVLSIQPSEATMSSGDTKQFQAYFVYSNMEPIDVTDICSWVSSNNNVATVNTAGWSNRLFGLGRVTALFNGSNNDNEDDNSKDNENGNGNGNGNGNNKDDENKSNGNGNGNGNGGNGNHYGWQYVGQNAGEYDGQAGLVTADNAGTATITASFDDIFWNYVIKPIFQYLNIPVDDTATATVTVMSPTLYITPENPQVAVDDTILMKAQLVYPDSDKTVDDVTEKATWSSSNNKNATVDSKGVVTGVKEGIVTISVTYKGKTQSTTVTVIGAQTFQVTPKTTNVDLNGTAALKAQILYADGSSSDVTSDTDTSWTVDDAKIARVDKGVITGLKLGSTVITGKYKGKYKDSATITVVNPVLKLSPSNPKVAVNSTIQLNASLGNTGISDKVTWSSSQPGVATMVAGTPGLFKGLQPGTTTITVTYINQEPVSVTLTVPAPSLTINTDKTIINNGTTIQLYADYDDGVNPKTDVTEGATWTANGLFNNNFLFGKLTAVQSGSIIVRASYNGIVAEKAINVIQPILTISPSPNLALNVGGSTVNLKAVYKDADTSIDGIDVTNSVKWTSESPNAISLTDAGVVKALQTGSSNISASYTNVYGKYVDSTIHVVATQPLLTISPKTKVNVGTSIDLKVFCTDAFGSNVDVTGRDSVIWSTSDPSILQVSPNGQITGKKAGNAMITVAYTTQDGVIVSESTEIEVIQPSLVVGPSLILVNVGVTSNTRLTATYTDADGERDVSSGVTWSSSSLNIASIDSSNGNSVKGNSAGSAKITASYPVPESLTHEILTAQTSVSVINPQSTKLLIKPYTTSADVGTKIQFRAYLNGIDVTDQVNWSTSDDNAISIGNVNDANNKKGLAEIKHSAGRPVTITAAYEGITGTAFLRVGPPGVVWEVEPPPQGN